MFEICNVRNDDKTAIDRLKAFLAGNPDPGVRERPEDQVKRALQTGLALELYDNDGTLCGCSLVYKFVAGEPSRIFSEIGTMRITANNFAFQTVLASLHLLQMDREESGAINGGTFAVVTPGSKSETNLVKHVGMSRWDPPPALCDARADEQLPFNPAKAVIFADRAAFEAAFASLQRWHMGQGVFATPIGGETFRVNMRWLTPELLAPHG